MALGIPRNRSRGLPAICVRFAARPGAGESSPRLRQAQPAHEAAARAVRASSFSAALWMDAIAAPICVKRASASAVAARSSGTRTNVVAARASSGRVVEEERHYSSGARRVVLVVACPPWLA